MKRSLSWGYQVNLLVPTDEGGAFVHFLTLGIGGITFTGRRQGQSETYFSGNAGFGIKLFVLEKAAVRLEVKDRIYRIGVFDEIVNDFHFTAGVELVL